VDVIDVPLEVAVVADDVLSIAALPDAFLPFGEFARGAYGRSGRPRENPDLISIHRVVKS